MIKKGDKMIKFNKVSYSFPEKNLYNNISFSLEEGQHCAFIGVSGSGKSTLIDMIMNPDSYLFEGQVEINPENRIGYVSQFYEVDRNSELTVFEYIAEDFIKLENKLEKIAEDMATAENIEELLEEYQETLDEFDALGGNDYESIIDKKLNLSNLMSCRDLLLSKISGGEFKLIQVIKEMLNLPDLLIMDEPDVFLDFENLNSLKNLINSYKNSLIVVTHSRYLLNHCFNKIIHLENMELREFDGNYIEYNFSLLKDKIELQRLAHEDNEEIKRNQLLIDRYRAKAGANPDSSMGQNVNARVSIQERLLARRVEEPFIHTNKAEMNFSSNTIDDDSIILEVDGLSIGFDDILLDNISFQIKSGEKVAIIGPNGSGKTSLLLEIFNNQNPAIQIKEGAKVAYLSQLKGQTLDESKTVNQELFDAGFKTYDEIKSYIKSYALDEEIVEQRIESLSGGEKNLLQLAKLSYNKSDLLILDEPTSNLDTYSQIALEKALKDYNGSILMVSHDFYSIVNCMDYALLIEDKKVRKSSMKKFKQKIYREHFHKDYLEKEKDKLKIELEIEKALKLNDFELAESLSEKLEEVIESF